MLETIPEPKTVDPIIERHRKTVEDEIRRSIILVFRFQPAWTEGGLKLALAERHVSMDDFWRHFKELGILQTRTRITDQNFGWWMYFIPDNWRPDDRKATS